MSVMQTETHLCRSFNITVHEKALDGVGLGHNWFLHILLGLWPFSTRSFCKHFTKRHLSDKPFDVKRFPWLFKTQCSKTNVRWMFTFPVFYNVIVQVVIEDFSPVLHISRSIWARESNQSTSRLQHDPEEGAGAETHRHPRSSRPLVCLAPSLSTAAHRPPHTRSLPPPPGKHERWLV